MTIPISSIRSHSTRLSTSSNLFLLRVSLTLIFTEMFPYICWSKSVVLHSIVILSFFTSSIISLFSYCVYFLTTLNSFSETRSALLCNTGMLFSCVIFLTMFCISFACFSNCPYFISNCCFFTFVSYFQTGLVDYNDRHGF